MTKRQDPTTAQLATIPSEAHAPAPGAPRAAHRRRRRVTRVAAAATAVLAAGALVVGCGKDPEPAPEKVGGDAAPAGSDKSGDSEDGKNGSADTGGKDGDGSGSGSSASDSKASGSSAADSSGSKSGSGSSSGSRCGTGDLKATFGDNHPGAGQENFALVLTNRSDDTCTVRGYPGLAFVNDAGEQVSFDPHRTDGKVRTVELKPGKSAWAPLSFTNPKMTNVTTVTPSAAKVTPPDERGSLRVDWSGGPVTNTGKASVPKIGPLSSGTGAGG
ncbi:DUF4232 domain-containing protein [Streptomyces qinglanensis]|uniref:DUF4232 domain-containing protein n=1 Tax=Streptomyces qinglanensis TaxID=943816 RepID=UPI00099F4752|nr:DUF4232 domain-containing protein [Streptomyces qinglanensis]